MFGWFRPKPGFADFAKSKSPRQVRARMSAANKSMRLIAGFEATIAERIPPKLGVEIAESQSLKSARAALRGKAQVVRSFKGEGK